MIFRVWRICEFCGASWRRDAISGETPHDPEASVHSQQQQRERELRKQHEREQRRRYEEMEQLRREEERRHAEREQVGARSRSNTSV